MFAGAGTAHRLVTVVAATFSPGFQELQEPPGHSVDYFNLVNLEEKKPSKSHLLRFSL